MTFPIPLWSVLGACALLLVSCGKTGATLSYKDGEALRLAVQTKCTPGTSTKGQRALITRYNCDTGNPAKSFKVTVYDGFKSNVVIESSNGRNAQRYFDALWRPGERQFKYSKS